MNKLINKQNLSLRMQQFVILILHLVLLKWMHFTLTESGSMNTTKVFIHFTGMSLYGALLIRCCAAWGKWLYEKDLKLKNES